MRLLVLPSLFLAAACLAAEPASKPAGVDGLSPDDIAKAISALKESYVRPQALGDAELARATLQGLLDRLAPGVTLIAGTGGAEGAYPFYSEAYTPRAGYLRLGELSEANIEKARETLKQWAGPTGVTAVVLDLRGTPPSSDFKAGADLARLFCTKGTEMFSLNVGGGRVLKSGTSGAGEDTQTYSAESDPAFTGILVVIVDSRTAEAPEAVAACLQKCAKALVVGDRTAGRAFEFTDVPLDGAVLRIAVAQVILSDGKELGECGLTPDISVGPGTDTKAALMQSVSAHGIASVTHEVVRPHLNEAALVAGSNPEVDELEREQAGTKPAEPLIDRQLQRALDLVTSISIYEAKGTASPAAGE